MMRRTLVTIWVLSRHVADLAAILTETTHKLMRRRRARLYATAPNPKGWNR